MKRVIKMACITTIITILFSGFILNMNVSASNNIEDYTEITYKDLYNDSIIDINEFIPYQENNTKSVSDIYYINYAYRLTNGQVVYYRLYCQFYSELLYTPNGTDVALPRNSDPTTYYVMKYLNDLPDEVKNDCEIADTRTFNVISLISQATTNYNCHSYAWYSQDILNNDIWISYPNAYYMDNDESYERVYDPKIGDIICYMDLDKEEEYQNIHSGVIVDYSGENSNNICGDSNKYIIQSKWGQHGLYQHKGDECPYTSKYEGDAEEVWYFRRVKHTYSLGNYTSNINKDFVIDSNMELTERYEIWKLDIEYTKYYEFNINANNALNIGLYDENMELIDILDLDNKVNHVRFIEQLYDDKTYYLRIAYSNKESTGTISTIIKNPCQGCGSLYRERVTLNCQTDPYEDLLYLQQNQTIIYELDLECNTRYDFEVASPNLLSVGLYDENMTLVAKFLYFQGTNNNNYYFNVQDLEEGIYHIKIELDSDSLDCDIQVTLDHSLASPEEILVNQPVDVLEHLHYNQNSYYFMQNRLGIYEVVLTGTSSNGTLVYPEGTITIVSGDTVVQKYVFTKGDYNNPATSLFGSNTMTWLVDDYASYYINIDINSTGLTSLQLEVRELETFSLSASDAYNKSSSLINGDKFEILNVERTGEYNVKATYTGNQVKDILFVILRKNSEGLFEEIDEGLVNNTSYFETNVILNTYEQIYIGYFNGKGSGTFSLNIDRNVSNTFSLMTDPNSNVIVGSEVSLNNGVYGGTTLTQGYTRIVYLGMDAPYIESRTQYNWYTTDSSVAIVSSFGTVTATAIWSGSETYKTVTIRAVYKNNITVVGEIELTVYKDPNANSTTKKILQYYGMDVRGDGTTGTEVSQNGGSKIDIGYMPEVTITKGYTRYICLGADSPSNIIQHFTWSVSKLTGETGNASVSQYGTITAIS